MQETVDEVERKYDLITRDLQEIVGGDDIKKTLEQRDVKIYWGTATTGKPHMGYFVPIMKLADFLEAGANVTILFADLHAFLDNEKSTWELLQHRCAWYEFVIKQMLVICGVPMDKLNFVRGTDYQLSRDYNLDVYKMSAHCPYDAAVKAGTEVVKQTKSPVMSSLLYPILQALDEHYLDVDIQFGGVDQRKIFMFAREKLPLIGYRKRSHLMNTLIPGLGKSGKMSSSEPLSKIDFDDSASQIKSKIKRAYSIDGHVEGNGLLSLMRHILFKYLRKQGKKFEVKKPERYGGESFSFENADELDKAFAEGVLNSGDLKPFVANLIIEFIAPLRVEIMANQALLNKAYPPPMTSGPFQIEMTVGKILSVKKHPEAERLFIEEIDVGEEKPRTIVSGLVGHYTEEELQDRLVIVFTNIAPATLVGVQSDGMVLAASVDGDSRQVDLLNIPEGTQVGAKVSYDFVGSPDKPTISKRKLRNILKQLGTTDTGVCVWKQEHMLKLPGGTLTSNLHSASLG